MLIVGIGRDSTNARAAVIWRLVKWFGALSRIVRIGFGGGISVCGIFSEVLKITDEHMGFASFMERMSKGSGNGNIGIKF